MIYKLSDRLLLNATAVWNSNIVIIEDELAWVWFTKCPSLYDRTQVLLSWEGRSLLVIWDDDIKLFTVICHKSEFWLYKIFPSKIKQSSFRNHSLHEREMKYISGIILNNVEQKQAFSALWFPFTIHFDLYLLVEHISQGTTFLQYYWLINSGVYMGRSSTCEGTYMFTLIVY